jgi:hypothetical protein
VVLAPEFTFKFPKPEASREAAPRTNTKETQILAKEYRYKFRYSTWVNLRELAGISGKRNRPEIRSNRVISGRKGGGQGEN